MRRKRSVVRIGVTAVGKGVFARRDFRPDDVIGEIRGKVIADPGYSSEYCIDLGFGRLLEPAAPYRFLNHSCEPNAQVFYWEAEDDHERPAESLWLHAIRPIRPGDELTIDYAWPADSAIPCGCRRPTCRGWVVSLEDLPKLQQPAGNLAGTP